MSTKGFWKAGHFPTLVAAFLYFDVSFMIWVLLGPLAPFLSETLHLTPGQKGMMVALPLLGGSLFRPILGLLGEVMGGRKAGLLGLTVTLIPLLLGWRRKLWNSHSDAVRPAPGPEIRMVHNFCFCNGPGSTRLGAFRFVGER